ncbi:oxidoreductase [Legionella feeleii]|uniref:Acetyoacetyl CoA reductase n=1 Tax=Legionella feeleii TaxID=453 RepID=A0A0W0U1D8_9GAMM|nr:oxidoreductase [Legionella feeleii]KTD01469.1 acetyoacetyl CoA reductase [Legionella feeleii]SPX61279.1 acetyoacetyl CoA reductase [Legionella feeleii]
MNQVLIKDKVVVVTGGAGLLGAEFVQAIARNGGIAIIADQNREAALDAVERISQHDLEGRVDLVTLDITDKTSILDVVKTVSEKYGKIDALVNNAYPRNKNYGRRLMEVEYSDFCENVNLNLGGYFLTSQQFAAYFMQQGYGNIINIASIYGVVAPKFEIYENTAMTMPVEYAVIKSGIIHLTKYFAKSFKGKQIRVNSLSPGGILDAQPASFVSAYKEECLNKGMLDKRDLSGSLIYLLSDLSSYVNGQNLIVDDGFTI